MITLLFDGFLLKFKFLMIRQISEGTTSLNDLPVIITVVKENGRTSKLTTLLNQGMNLGEWIQHLCSFTEFNDSIRHHADFYIGRIMFDLQTLRNTFPKLQSIGIDGGNAETNEHTIFIAQTILKAFLPDVRSVQLNEVPLQENLSLQHIGMANLKRLETDYQSNLNIDDLCALNVERYITQTNQIAPRCLNRFFKLWIKGSNPMLRELDILCDTEIVPDWNVFLRGLKAEDVAAEDDSKKFKIVNYRGICAEIKFENFDGFYGVKFEVHID
ncbi:hypothetical protein B9Z55_026502 [Caenorhabditis nigoni]|uniref:Sdz-33 F-box domain-containing protein n=1 Tax=Caenorhabditis nigoni TaxID=1611254 RepID=A0A2G5T3F9_9PELO|nr:hypothetical protein B9Z55_026502 [Caenorhabditis nigoni]